ncbi:MAG: PmoA family protein [Pirellulales bacterium]|nr:PmoA family protein [Pirellulales bacterium]
MFASINQRAARLHAALFAAALLMSVLNGPAIFAQFRSAQRTVRAVAAAPSSEPTQPSGVARGAKASSLAWRRTDSSLGLKSGENTLWEFQFDPKQDAPYFHPVGTREGQVLTWNSPADHPWHHAVWFSWKYINGVNYWEHNRQTGRPDGRTRWEPPLLETKGDGSAQVRMRLSYGPAGREESLLTEDRQIDLGAPDAEGNFSMDWICRFQAHDQEVLFDRTPPHNQSSGGYAGLSIRFAKGMEDRQLIRVQAAGSAPHNSQEPTQFGAGDRYRGRGAAMDYSGLLSGRPAGIAFLDHPANPRHPTPWYAVGSPIMSYLNAALLNDEPLKLAAHGSFVLRYRLIVHSGRWSAEQLSAAYSHYAEGTSAPSQLKPKTELEKP